MFRVSLIQIYPDSFTESPDEEVFELQSGVIYRLVQRHGNPFGFIRSDENDVEVYFNRRSLSDINSWDKLVEGGKVSFDVIPSRPPFKHIADNIKVLDSSE